MIDGRRQTGILGGTFDPVHTGHMILAQEVMEKCSLDEIIFIPSGIPPHKPAGSVSSGRDRLAMLRLALRGCRRFRLSDMEIRRPGVTYTVDTMAELRESGASHTDYYYIIGADNVTELKKWKNHAELLRTTGFIAACRPGFDATEAAEEARRLNREYGADIRFAETPEIDISSTGIRERIAAGKEISFLVPAAVERYIRSKGLYRAAGEGA